MWQEFLYDKQYLLEKGTKTLEPMCGYCEGKRILERHLGQHIEYSGFDLCQPLVEEAKKEDPYLNVFVEDMTRFDTSEKYDANR
jgi:hypothetical protein